MSLGAGGGGREELQQLSEEIESLREEQDQLEGTVEELEASQEEIDEVVEGLGELETGSTVQVPLGAGTYVRAEIEDIEEVVVSLGGSYAAELDRDGARDALADRRAFIDERIEETEAEIAEIEDEAEELEAEAQQAQQQMLQQLQQQQGGAPGQGEDDG